MTNTALAARFRNGLSQSDKRLKIYGFEGVAAETTFADFYAEIVTTSKLLEALGVGPGVVVAVLGPTSLDLCRSAAAIWNVGATLTVLPTPTRLGDLELFVRDTLAKLSQSCASLLLAEPSMAESLAELVAVPTLSWHLTEAGSSTPLAVNKLDREAALIQFSSGTTRDPKPIVLTESSLLANADAVLAKFPGGASRHSCVSWLPLYHDMGLLGCFLMPLLAPANLTLMGPEVFAARPVTWLEAISAERATTSSAPNFALAYCADRISEEELSSLDLSCWSVSMVGAETVRPATLRRFAERFAPVGFDAKAFSPVYGLAEATLAVTFSPFGQGMKTFCFDSQVLAETGRVVPGQCETASLGRPLEGIEVRILGESGEELEQGRLGDVYVRGESVFSGYLHTEEPAKLSADGWLQTGDTGFLYQHDLYLYGRRRDILLLDGRNHDPNQVEGAAEALEPLRRCCAFTREGEDHDSLVLVCEVASAYTGEPEPLRKEILSTVRRQSGLTPSELLLVKAGSLPSTSSGKLRRSETATVYAAGQLLGWPPEASTR